MLLMVWCLLVVGHCVTFESLYERELKSSYGFEILKFYHDQQFGDEDVKKFQGQSLLFMAPWKKDGIPLALKYINKFDYFVPCYYDFKKVNETITLETSQHYNLTYLQEIKRKNPNVKIIPRVYTHGVQGDVFLLSSTSQQQHEKMLKLFDDVLSNQIYDGVMFSSPFITPSHKYPFSIKNILKDIRKVADNHSKLFMITLDGVDNKPEYKINKKKARDIIDQVHKVIINNYDYPKGNEGSSIPISPMHWIIQNWDFYCEVYSKKKIQSKIIMAIPLYGYFIAMYGKYDPLDGKEFLAKLSKENKAYLHWNQDIQECMVVLNKMEYIYFPCLHFYQSRLRYLESIGVGVGAFEIGSGLEIFMQMF